MARATPPARKAATGSRSHDEPRRNGSLSYRNGAGMAARAALGVAELAANHPKLAATAALGTAAALKVAQKAAKAKAGRVVENVGSGLAGYATRNPKVICPNPKCKFHTGGRVAPSKFVKRSASLFGSYEVVFCSECGVVFGAFANTDRLMDAMRR